MTKRNMPWSLKGVSLEARDAARAAAQREGLTIGAWLDRAIRTAASHTTGATVVATEAAPVVPAPPAPDPEQPPAAPRSSQRTHPRARPLAASRRHYCAWNGTSRPTTSAPPRRWHRSSAASAACSTGSRRSSGAWPKTSRAHEFDSVIRATGMPRRRLTDV